MKFRDKGCFSLHCEGFGHLQAHSYLHTKSDSACFLMCMYIYVKRKYQYRHPPISSISCLYLFLSYNVIHLPIPKKNKAPTDSNPLNFPSFSSLFLSRFPKHQGVAQHAPCQLRQLRLQLSPQLLQLRRRHGTSGRLRSSARRIWNDRGLPLTWRGSKATKGGSKLRKT